MKRDGVEVGVADLLAGRIPVGVVGALNRHSGLGFGGGDELDDGADVGEGSTPPVLGYEAEQAVLDPVPLRGAGRVAAFIDEVADQSGMTLRLPAPMLARIILAAADGLTYTVRIDGEDLFAPFLEVLHAGMIADG